MCAKNSHNRWSSDKTISKIKRCCFFASHGIAPSLWCMATVVPDLLRHKTPPPFGQHRFMQLSNRSTCVRVWTACPKSLRESRTARIELATCRSQVRSPHHYTTSLGAFWNVSRSLPGIHAFFSSLQTSYSVLFFLI